MDLKDYKRLKKIFLLHKSQHDKSTYSNFEVQKILKTIMKDIVDEFGC